MDEAFVRTAIGSLSVLLLVEVSAFVAFYGFGSRWRSSLIGRTMMQMAGSFALILLYSFGATWIGVPDEPRRLIGIPVYALLVLAWARMFFALRAAQRGKITAENPNYSPIKDWLSRRAVEKRRAEKKARDPREGPEEG